MQTMEERTAARAIEELKERMDERFDDVSAEFQRIDKRFDDVTSEFQRIDKRFDRVDARFQNVESDIRELRGDLKASTAELRGDIKSMQRTMLYGFMTLGGIIMTLAGLIAAIQVL